MRWWMWVAGMAAAAGISYAVVVVVNRPSPVRGNSVSQDAPAFLPKTADYYMAHRDEMKARETACGNSGISPMGDSPEARDCNAATEAERRIFFGNGS